MTTPYNPALDLWQDCAAQAANPCDCSAAYCVQCKTIYADKLWEGFQANYFQGGTVASPRSPAVYNGATDVALSTGTNPDFFSNSIGPFLRFNPLRRWTLATYTGYDTDKTPIASVSATYEWHQPGNKLIHTGNYNLRTNDGSPGIGWVMLDLLNDYQGNPNLPAENWVQWTVASDLHPNYFGGGLDGTWNLSNERDINQTIIDCYAAINTSTFNVMVWGEDRAYHFNEFAGAVTALNISQINFTPYDGSVFLFGHPAFNSGAAIPAAYSFFGLKEVNGIPGQAVQPGPKLFLQLASSRVKGQGEYILVQSDFNGINQFTHQVVVGHGFFPSQLNPVGQESVLIPAPGVQDMPLWQNWPISASNAFNDTGPVGRMVRLITGCNPQGFIAHNPTATIASGVN